MEYIRKCNVCGKLYCYTDQDISESEKNALLGAISAIGGVVSAFGGGTIFHTSELNRRTDRYTDKVIDFEKCPHCNSRNTVLIQEGELLQQSIEIPEKAKTVEINTNATTATLLKRAEMFLQDEEWANADAYAETVLDVEPENALAYVYKLMAELKVCEREDLKHQQQPFDGNKNYKKAIRFGDEGLVKELTSTIHFINNRNEEARKKSIYTHALDIMNSAETEDDYLYAADEFSKLSEYRDAKVLERKCCEKAEEARKNAVYDDASAKAARNTVDELNKAIERFKQISDWRDSAERIKACEKHIVELKAKAEAERIAADEKAKKTKKTITVAAVLTVLLAIAAAVFVFVVRPAMQYNKAVELRDNGDYEGAIVVFAELGDYKDAAEQALKIGYSKAVELRDSGDVIAAAQVFGKLGDYQDAREQAFAFYSQFDGKIAAGGLQTVGLRSDGTAVAVGANSARQCNVSNWADIVAVSAGNSHTVGLRSDGTVVAAGWNAHRQCDVSNWTDIVAVSAGGLYTVGLRSDGTVVAAGDNHYGRCDVSDWCDIVAVSAGDGHTVGLRSDGTVVAVGWNGAGQCDVSDWTDIVAVSVGDGHTVGLRSDGTVVAAGWNEFGQCDVSDWHDIVAVSAGGLHTVGLRSDGTVVAVGENSNGTCDVSDWTDIVAVSAGNLYTVGLHSDGTVVAVGYNDYGQCDVSNWADITS